MLKKDAELPELHVGRFEPISEEDYHEAYNDVSKSKLRESSPEDIHHFYNHGMHYPYEKQRQQDLAYFNRYHNTKRAYNYEGQYMYPTEVDHFFFNEEDRRLL